MWLTIIIEDVKTSSSSNWGDEWNDDEPDFPKPKKESILKPVSKKPSESNSSNFSAAKSKPTPEKKSSDGWDDDDENGWDDNNNNNTSNNSNNNKKSVDDDEGWDDFGAPSKLGTSGGERKLTRMELAQLKKEEAAKRRKWCYGDCIIETIWKVRKRLYNLWKGFNFILKFFIKIFLNK